MFLSDQETDSDRNANVHCQMMSHCLRMKFVHKLTEEDLSSCVKRRSLLYIRVLRIAVLSDSLHSHFPGLIPV